MVSRDEIVTELQQVRLDLQALEVARDTIQQRINDMSEERQKIFTNWAATQAIFNVFIMATTRCEGLIQDYQKLLDEPSDNVIQLVRGDQNDIDR